MFSSVSIKFVKKALSLTVLTIVQFVTMSFVIEIDSVPKELFGSKFYIYSQIDDSAVDSVLIDSTSMKIDYRVEQPFWGSLRYSHAITGGIRTWRYSFYLENDTMSAVIHDFAEGKVKFTNNGYTDFFAEFRKDLEKILEQEPDSSLHEKLTLDFIERNIRETSKSPLCTEFLLSSIMQTDPEKWLELYDLVSPEIASYPPLIQVATRLKQAMKIKKGSDFIDFEGCDLSGNPINFSDYIGQGKYVLVDFWATWCVPCRQEALRTITPLYEMYKDRDDFMILGVITLQNVESVLPVADMIDYPWTQMIDSKQQAPTIYAFQAIPYLMLFSPEGKLLQKGIRGKSIVEAVENALSNK